LLEKSTKNLSAKMMIVNLSFEEIIYKRFNIEKSKGYKKL